MAHIESTDIAAAANARDLRDRSALLVGMVLCALSGLIVGVVLTLAVGAVL